MLGPNPDPSPLVGLWRLSEIAALYPGGAVDPAIYGHEPVGYLSYAADGHMMVMFAKGDRADLSGKPNSPFALEAIPPEELAEAFTSFSAYAGTYSVQGNRVDHHLVLASLPNRVGTRLERTFRLDGDRLTLTTPETDQSGVAMVYRLTWQRERR